ncbi:MAG: DNA adenine methylase [Candidatus Obscuribacterales bacterium]|nr:DNA adenine methylase [Candidatus Obscuribacterales bacterium]
MGIRASRPRHPRLTGLPSNTVVNTAGPFLKWAGGKSQLLTTFSDFLPESFDNYFEPFVGGAAVFFYLRRNRPLFRATLADLNQELVNCYQTIRDDVEELILSLKEHKNEAEYFYQLRAKDPLKMSEVERASRLIFMNKTCFNGLYRVNSKGKFNVPFGSYKNPRTCDEANLRACSKVLQDANIRYQPFEAILKQAKKGDFIYFDPPYQPLSSTAKFTSYTKNSFSSEDQERLAETFSRLDKRGCRLMLSNSDCQFIRDLYKDFRIETVQAMRAINCQAVGRGRVNEVVVMNY